MIATIAMPECEPLIKAFTKTKPLKQDLGSWQGLPIVAIGPKGGKIVGYGSGGKPIYAGSKQAKTLAAISKQEGTQKADSTGEWLLALGIPNKIKDNAVYVQPGAATLLEEHFNVVGTKVGGAVKFSFTEVFSHVGEPLKPKGDEQQSWAAGVAAGEVDVDPFPDLSTLKQVSAGKYSGSHGNLLFEDPSGRKWIFKGTDSVIARSEEAACRIGRLILGNKIPPAKHVEIQGKSGVLLGDLPGEALNESSHSHPPLEMLQKYAGQVAQHHVVDWLISNHDGHAGNFLAYGGKLNGIDKGQSWKFFGKDELTANYSPNPSKPIYVTFWNAVKDGLISLDELLGPIGEALDKAEQVSDKQFKSIIAPYVSTAAGHIGFDPQKKMASMTKRLQNLRADFETFLSGIAKNPVKIPSKHADNFETMPEAEGLPGEPKLTIKVPGKPETLEGGAKTPVVAAEKVSGWPATKGKVTIMHPGEPSPGGTWPKGYPGPGFNASITYKKQKFTVEFTTNMQGGIAVGVYYPDGSFSAYDSPNQASDSMYLFVKSLPLNMSATEKKKQGISLPAKKAFGITAFKDELTKAHAGELPPAAMNPAELEQAKVIEKDAPELTVKGIISKMPDGVIDDWDELPHEVKEALLANQFEIGKNYPHGIPPGVAYKATEEGEPVIYTAKQGTSAIGPAAWYTAWEFMGDTLIHDDVHPQTIDATYNLESNAMLQSIKKDMAQGVAETADEQIGAPPPAELPKDAVVPESAPKHHAGPVPPGTQLKVKKKFPWGKAEVMLIVSDDGKSFQVVTPDEEANFEVTNFDSLSAASDHVWVKQKGYKDAAAYKQATGKAKVPSGGGWKFWGIKPGATPAPKQKVPKTKEGTPGMTNLDAFPETHALYAYPVGTVLIWQQGGKVYKAKKVEDIKWDLTTPHKGLVKGVHQQSLDSFQPTAENVKIKVAEQKPKPHPSISKDNFETMPDVPSQVNLEGMAIGTVLKFSSLLADYEATKMADYEATKMEEGKWMLKYGSEIPHQETSGYIAELLNAINMSNKNQGLEPLEVEMKAPPPLVQPPGIHGYADPLEGLPVKWNDLSLTLTKDFLQGQPEGTQFKVNGVIYVKTGEGGSIWLNTKTGKGLFPGVLYDEIHTEAIQMRVLDVKEFQKKYEAGELWTKYEKPEGSTSFDVLEQLPQKAMLKLDGVEFVHTTKDGTVMWQAPDKALFSDYHMADKVDDAVEVMVLKNPPKGTQPATPSEANWVTMPEGKKDAEYASQLAKMAIGTTLKFMSESGKQWHAIKDSETSYTLVSPSGKKVPKGEVGIAAFLVDKSNIVYTKAGADFDPLAALLAGNEKKTYDIPALPDAVFAAMSNMKDGDVLEWEEPPGKYRVEKQDGIWQLYDLSDGTPVSTVKGENADTAFEYVSFSAGATNFKMTSTTPPTGEAGWKSIVKKITGQGVVKNIVKTQPGTTYKFWNTVTGERDVITKIDHNKWFLASTNGYLGNDDVVQALNKAIGAKGEVQKQVLDLSKAPKPPPTVPAKSQEQLEQEKKAKEIVDWAKVHEAVTNSDTLHVLSHVQDHFTLYDANMTAWARMDGEHVLMGSDNPKFEQFITDLKKASPDFEVEWVESPIGKLARFRPEAIAAALPGNPAGMMQGPDGKTYPNGTTFKEKETAFTKEELLKQHPSFYKIKPHKEDPDSVVVKVVGTGDSQKKDIMEMLVNAKVPFTGDAEGYPIVGSQSVLAFVKKADLEKIGKTETTIEAHVPPQPSSFRPKTIPYVSAPTGYKDLLIYDDVKSVTQMILPRMGRSIAIGKSGIFRDNHLKVRRVHGADGKVYTEFYGTLAAEKALSEAEGWQSGTVHIPSAANVSSDLSPYHTHNYDSGSGLSVEKPGTDPTYSESGFLNTTDGGSPISVHSGSEVLKNMFRVRIEDGKDIEEELGNAFQKMGYVKKDVLAPMSADAERVWKKWSLVRAAMGPVGFQKELREDVKQTWDEQWLDSQLKSLVPDYQSKLDSMVLQETFEGHPTWIVQNDVDHFRKAGWKFAYRSDPDWKSICLLLSQGVGWASQKTRGQNGATKMAVGIGISAGADITSGGADSAFFRASKNWSAASPCDTIIMHPRAFLRTDWRRYYGDAYGNITGQGSGAHYVQGAPGRYEDLDSVGVECVWQGGAPLSDMLCVLVSNGQDKKSLMSALKERGIEHINGVALEDFVLVGSHDLPNRIHPSLRPGPEWGDDWK